MPVLCCPRLGTEPAGPCQEQGEDRQTTNMSTFTRGSECGGDRAWLPASSAGHPAQQEARVPFRSCSNLLLPKAPGPLCINWWDECC